MTDRARNYLPDREAALEGVRDAVAGILWARYELAGVVKVGRELGLTLAELAEPLGVAGPSGVHKRLRGLPAITDLDDGERERFARMLRAGARADRFEVRRILSGKRGDGSLRWETVSVHLRPGVAQDRLGRLPGRGGAVWRLEPNGRRHELSGDELRKAIRTDVDRRARLVADRGELPDYDAPF